VTCNRVNKPLGEQISLLDNRAFLDEVFEKYHHAEFISPDPLEFLHHYDDPLDREIVGLISSSLAYGRVCQILKSVRGVLYKMGQSPRAFLEETPEADIRDIYYGFKHRFTTDVELIDLLMGIRHVIRIHGSLHRCFITGLSAGDETTLPALCSFVREIYPHAENGSNSLIPDPGKKSACKRLHLFLRWMVRSDEIDPGGWDSVSPAQLIVPLDVHMFRISTMLGLTSRPQADERTAREITAGFRGINRKDPVMYDFSLTRLGILRDKDFSPAIRG
jgi:uncharacterized protein (TIGR02757 family)